MHSVLIVDDEKNIREGLSTAFKGEGYRVLLADDGVNALDLIKKDKIDLVITDLNMPRLNGQQLVEQALVIRPLLKIVILTGFASVDGAVELMKKGAFDFLTKPVNLEHLFLVVSRALETSHLQSEQKILKEALDSYQQQLTAKLNSQSPLMQQLNKAIMQAAPTKASVLILGESGVGKELVAEVIHSLSGRKNKPFIKVHCAALSEQLLESELFGHEKGAFTGAVSRRKGRFELADGGDIFLDEIGELSPSVQVKLLRVLQERCFERLGGEETIKVDIRLITATNRNLQDEVAQGRFREDLYYRLNVVQFNVPPLRERSEDILVLAHKFLQEFCTENNKDCRLSQAAIKALQSYSWPGNVRELRNCIENTVIMATGQIIDKTNLPLNLPKEEAEIAGVNLPLTLTLNEVENIYIKAVLKAEQGNKSKAANRLGISRKTLQRKESELDEE